MFKVSHLLWWYELLPNPTVQQTTFVSLIVGLFVPIMKFYFDASSPIIPTSPGGKPNEPT